MDVDVSRAMLDNLEVKMLTISSKLPGSGEYIDRIFCKSCQAMEELPDSSVALTVTSPPYWNAIDYDRHVQNPGQNYRTRSYSVGYHDYRDYLGWLRQISDEILRVTKPGGFMAMVIGTVLLDRKHYPVPFDVVSMLTGGREEWHEECYQQSLLTGEHEECHEECYQHSLQGSERARNAKSASGSHAKSSVRVNAESQAGPHSKSGIGVNAESQVGPHSKSGTGVNVESQAGPHSESGIGVNAESQAGPHSRSGTGVNAEYQAGPHGKSGIGANWEFHQDIIWHKVTGGVKRAGVFIQKPYPGYFYPNIMTEYILIFRKPGPQIYKGKEQVNREEARVQVQRLFTNEIANTVWHIAPVPPRYLKHPCPFPEDIPYRLIQLYSYPKDLVLDPFCGSGQTLKVAGHLGRHYCGYDINREYVELARKRIIEPLAVRHEQLIAVFEKSPITEPPLREPVKGTKGRPPGTESSS